MDTNSGYWEEEGIEDRPFLEGLDPLLLLAADLAICCAAAEEYTGSMCVSCACELGYHIPCDSGECEFCGCDEIRILCASCDRPRALESFQVGSRTCHYCVDNPPARIPTSITRRRLPISAAAKAPKMDTERAKAARMALTELTE